MDKDPDSNLWFEEPYTEGLRFQYRVKRYVAGKKTMYQYAEILDLFAFGRTLFLDGKLQSAEIDEHIYHDMLVHPAMLLHPAPRNVLIMGGGEGATLREVLKHPVEKVYMVDIDEELVKMCKEYLPSWHDGSFDDKRSIVLFQDARKFVEEYSGEPFDVVISDLTEPVEEGPAIYLFTKDFYEILKDRMSPDAVFVAQAGSAEYLYTEFISALSATLKEVFPVVFGYHEYIFSFQLNWAFLIASKKYALNERKNDMIKRFAALKDRIHYFTPEYFFAKTVLPPYMKKSMREGAIITDKKPYVWKA